MILRETYTTNLSEMTPRVTAGMSAKQLTDLTAGDENPVFVTLQIGQVGARSHNDRRYPREVYEVIVDTINVFHIGGIRGHLRDDERSSAHPEMVWRWVGAQFDAQGRVWGKAYVLKTQAQAREEIRTAVATGARIGTSLYATGTVNGEGIVEAEGFILEGIDYVHEARVGIPQTATKPVITREMREESSMFDTKSERLREQIAAVLVENFSHVTTNELLQAVRYMSETTLTEARGGGGHQQLDEDAEMLLKCEEMWNHLPTQHRSVRETAMHRSDSDDDAIAFCIAHWNS